jgi:hypothetical protein
MSEPAFWDFKLKQSREPICASMIENFDKLYIELTHFAGMAAHWSLPYFNPLVVDPDNGDQTPLYTGNWTTLPVGYVDEERSVSPEFLDFKAEQEKKLDMNLDDTIRRLRKRGLPILHGLIWRAERDKKLANAFLGTLHPGAVVNRHKGWTKEYVRVHLALSWDDDAATITVGDETRTWMDGDILAFRDQGPYFISMKNESKDQERLYLSFDLSVDYLKEYIDIE